MPITYHAVERGNPSDPSAAKKYYASSMVTGTSDLEEITERIEKLCTVNGADIRAVLYAITEVVPELLSEGKNVHMGELGTFRVSISSSGSASVKEVSEKNIRYRKIIFTPGKRFKRMLKGLRFVKKQLND